jgi:glycosyltransferase involved in cell wall biosynthesis
VYIGRVVQKSNLDLLIDALSRPNCAGVTLDIIGDGDDKARLQARCAELNLDKRVTWHDGTVDEAKIAAVFNRCQLFVYPGAVGLSLIHALAYGLPVVVHDDRWKHGPEIAALDKGKNGHTFANGDPVALSEVIAGTLGKPADLTRMSAAAIATTDESFNAADMADRFCDAIAKLLDADTASPSGVQALTSTSSD